MRYTLFNLATAVSLLFWLATLAFRLTGYSWIPAAVWHRTTPVTTTSRSIAITGGWIHIDTVSPPTNSSPSSADFFAGFGYVRGPAYTLSPTGGPNILIGDIYTVLIPFWPILTLAAILPLYAAARLARAKFLIPPGHCRTCGYDLRASPDRCPECGTPAARA